MEFIPVIDLCGGLVVHARGGERSRYQPLDSPLCNSSEPQAVVAALAALYRFNQLYVADLDALQHNGNNAPLLAELIKQFPQLLFWLDAGEQSVDLAGRHPSRVRPVFASEAYTASELAALCRDHEKAIVSMDFDANDFRGDTHWLEMPAHWPKDLIIMELAAIGTSDGHGNGPATTRLLDFIGAHPDKRFYAAGGIRHDADIDMLEKIGVYGVLVATALHNGAVQKYKRQG
ncbi:MAG: HisA/HisF-related TIM barrel protein [Gammaproteobacteria bacterium]